MKYIFFSTLVLIVGCSSSYNHISLPAYFSSDDSGLGWSLELNEDSTFIYGDGLASCSGGRYSEGIWFQIGDTLVLNSFPSPKIEYFEEHKGAYTGKLKIYVFGTDTNNFEVSHIYYFKDNSLHPFIRKFDSEMSAKYNFNKMLDVFYVNKIKLLPTNQKVVIRIDEFDLSFEIKDTTNDIINVYINDFREQNSLDRKSYLDNHKILIKSDQLFWGYNKGEYFFETHPAIKRK